MNIMFININNILPLIDLEFWEGRGTSSTEKLIKGKSNFFGTYSSKVRLVLGSLFIRNIKENFFK
jgi:hypothetical protein